MKLPEVDAVLAERGLVRIGRAAHLIGVDRDRLERLLPKLVTRVEIGGMSRRVMSRDEVDRLVERMARLT